MIKIFLFNPLKSDVGQMRVRGWDVDIKKNDDGFIITVTRNQIKFVLYNAQDNTLKLMKYIGDSPDPVERKPYYLGNSKTCEGILYINEHSIPSKCYAFWRPQELENLMASCGLEKLSFRKDQETKFNMILDHFDEGFNFITDGKFSTSEDQQHVEIFDATYVADLNRKELILVQQYDIEELSEKILNEIYR